MEGGEEDCFEHLEGDLEIDMASRQYGSVVQMMMMMMMMMMVMGAEVWKRRRKQQVIGIPL